jgi:RHS repeat-associated protein
MLGCVRSIHQFEFCLNGHSHASMIRAGLSNTGTDLAKSHSKTQTESTRRRTSLRRPHPAWHNWIEDTRDTPEGDILHPNTGEQQDASGRVYLRARVYEPYLARFMTKDTWAGNINKPMSYNAWLYGYANPVINTDPGGHNATDPGGGYSVLVKFTSDGIQEWDQREVDVVIAGAQAVANAYANQLKSARLYMLSHGVCDENFYLLVRHESPVSIFLLVHGGRIIFNRKSEEVNFMGETAKKNLIHFYNQNEYTNATGPDGKPITGVDGKPVKVKIGVNKFYLPDYPRLVVHEIGHAFDLATMESAGTRLSSSVPTDLYRPLDDGIIMHYDEQNNLYFGYKGGLGDWQFGSVGSQSQEEFADMFVGWTY